MAEKMVKCACKDCGCRIEIKVLVAPRADGVAALCADCLRLRVEKVKAERVKTWDSQAVDETHNQGTNQYI